MRLSLDTLKKTGGTATQWIVGLTEFLVKAAIKVAFWWVIVMAYYYVHLDWDWTDFCHWKKDTRSWSLSITTSQYVMVRTEGTSTKTAR